MKRVQSLTARVEWACCGLGSAAAAGSAQENSQAQQPPVEITQVLDILERALSEHEERHQNADAVSRAVFQAQQDAFLAQQEEATTLQQSLHARVASLEQDLQHAHEGLSESDMKAEQLAIDLGEQADGIRASAEKQQALQSQMQQLTIVKSKVTRSTPQRPFSVSSPHAARVLTIRVSL